MCICELIVSIKALPCFGSPSRNLQSLIARIKKIQSTNPDITGQGLNFSLILAGFKQKKTQQQLYPRLPSSALMNCNPNNNQSQMKSRVTLIRGLISTLDWTATLDFSQEQFLRKTPEVTPLTNTLSPCQLRKTTFLTANPG